MAKRETAAPGGMDRRTLLRNVSIGVAAATAAGNVARGETNTASSGKEHPRIWEVQKTYGDDLIKLKGVVGHAIGLKGGIDALQIYVKDDGAKEYIANLLRDTIYGYPVVIVVGTFTIR